MLLCALVVSALMSGAGPAQAAVTVEAFDFNLSSPQAAAHPELDVSFAFVDPGEPETAKDVRIGAPQGLFLYPDAAPACGTDEFGEFECPPSTQVGLATVRAGHEGNPNFLLGTAPLYRVAAGHGQFMRFGLVLPTLEMAVELPTTIRVGGDYGLDLRIPSFSQLTPLAGVDLTMWAVPADPAHDSQRFPQGSQADPAGCPGIEGTGCLVGDTSAEVPAAPLTRNPTSCAGPLSATLEANSWQEPEAFETLTDSAISPTGCGLLAFSPSLTAALSTTETASPTGLDLDLQSSGETSPTGLSWADLRTASVALPAGMTIDGEVASTHPICTLAEAHLDADGPDECPAESRVGTFTAGVLGLDPPASGSAYFGGVDSPGAYRLILIAIGGGVDLRRVATLQSDTGSGAASISVGKLPQFPIVDLGLELDEEAGLLLTPGQCGDYEMPAELTRWSDLANPVSVSDSVTIDSGCLATDVEVSLEPASIQADGESVSVATATVTDANGQPFAGEEVAFESSDPDQQVGHVTDNGDGTYTVEIIASTAAGVATITAVDESVDPAISGTATLTQTAIEQPTTDPPVVVPPPPPPPPNTAPLVKLTKRPPQRGHDRTPTFRFTANETASFSCRLDRRPARPCTSPLTLPRLAFGAHTLRVQATDAAGQASETAIWKFTVRPR